MEEKNRLKFRRMEERDAREAAGIERENFSAPWTEKAFSEAAGEKNAVYLAAELEGKLAGYAGMWKALDEGEITNVSVKPSFQGRGIGRRLMEALLAEGKKEGVSSYFLEVRKSNERARKLYESLGFVQIGIRKDFYEAPREDGILMKKTCLPCPEASGE